MEVVPAFFLMELLLTPYFQVLVFLHLVSADFLHFATTVYACKRKKLPTVAADTSCIVARSFAKGQGKH